MTRRSGTVPARCGRTRRHTEHTWDTKPPAEHDYLCDGSPSPRSALQIVADQPALLELRGTAGLFIAEGVRSA